MGNLAKPIGAAGKVFRDPVHGLIRIESGDDFVRDLIDTPEFQRLRRVRQLYHQKVADPVEYALAQVGLKCK